MFQHLKSIWQLVHCSTFNTQDISTLQTSCIVQNQRWNLGSMGSWYLGHGTNKHQIGKLSVTLLPSTSAHTTERCLLWKNEERVQRTAAEWTSPGLCGGASWCLRRCRRTERRPCGPGTLPLSVQDYLRVAYWCCYVWTPLERERKITPTTCHCVQMHIRHSSLICWYSCMQQLLRP